MKPFKLHTILKYRKQKEDSAALRLTRATRKMEGVKSRLDTLISEQQDLDNKISLMHQSGVEISELIRCEDRRYWIKNQVHLVDNELQKAKQQVENERQKLIKCSRDKKVMEKLKENQDVKYKKFIDKKENNQLDEIAILSHDKNIT